MIGRPSKLDIKKGVSTILYTRKGRTLRKNYVRAIKKEEILKNKNILPDYLELKKKSREELKKINRYNNPLILDMLHEIWEDE